MPAGHHAVKVESYMTASPETIGAEQTVSAAAERMREHGIRHLPVLHGGALVGILSDRDVALVESMPGVDMSELPVSEAMTAEPATVAPDADLVDVASKMAKHRWGAMVVVSDQSVVGVFTTTDALMALTEFVFKAEGDYIEKG